jgi:hypothetical protein
MKIKEKGPSSCSVGTLNEDGDGTVTEKDQRRRALHRRSHTAICDHWKKITVSLAWINVRVKRSGKGRERGL